MADFQWAIQQILRGKKVCRDAWYTTFAKNNEYAYWDLKSFTNDSYTQMSSMFADDWRLYEQVFFDWAWAVEQLEAGKKIKWLFWKDEQYLIKHNDTYYIENAEGYSNPLEAKSEYFLKAKWMEYE